MPVEIPPALAATVAGVHGEQGRAWVVAAPARIERAAARWGFTLHEPFPNLTYHYVAPVTLAGGGAAVLKAGVPAQDFLGEITALRHFDGRGAVRLLQADPADGLLLLERVQPGPPLCQLDDDDAETRIAAGVLRRLCTPPAGESGLPTLERHFRAFARLRARFDGGTGPLPADLVARSERLAGQLLATSPPPMVLHGDFHHHNVLLGAGGEWRVIDPAGVVGDPAAEPAMFLCNPHERIERTRDLAALMARRVEIFAGALGLDRDRIVGWGVAWATMSACWHLEDRSGGEEEALRCARAIATLLPR